MKPKLTVGRRLAVLLTRAGVTGRAFATTVSLAPETLSRIRNDRFTPGAATRARIAAALGVPERRIWRRERRS